MRRMLVATAALLLSLAGCGGGSNGTEGATTTTTEATTTTVDPAVTIRRYASVVAKHRVAIERHLTECRPMVSCTVEGADAYLAMANEFRELEGHAVPPPDEIAHLVADADAFAKDRLAEPARLLTNCVDEAPLEAETNCYMSAYLIHRALSQAAQDLQAWQPYM